MRPFKQPSQALVPGGSVRQTWLRSCLGEAVVRELWTHLVPGRRRPVRGGPTHL